MDLKAQLRRAERARRRRAFALAVPLLVFLAFAFLAPIAAMLYRSVADPEVGKVLPRVTAALDTWDGHALPDEAAFAALAADLRDAKERRTVGEVGRRLNFERSGYRSLLSRTARRVRRGSAPWKAWLKTVDARWHDVAYWRVLQRASGPYTATYLLAALDHTYDGAGEVVPVPPERAIYVDVFWRTFVVSFQVTLLCLLLGYPVAYLLAAQPPARANLLLVLVLLPFWTSLLVRTTAWIVLLQTNGVVNDLALWAGLTSERVQLVFNRTGVLVAMTHILLPFMVLPLYSVMRGISPAYVRAARSLGARPWTAFRRVYLPQTMPGVAAGALLVFILAIGYYITPALVGGPRDQLISYFVAQHTNETLNWGLAAALGAMLLGLTLALYLVFQRAAGVDRLRIG